jgi:DNA excision repair protein ERCC-3
LYDSDKPLVIQSDHSVLLEADHPQFEAARDFLARFAELEASPEHVHTYRITHLSLWNAAESGLKAEEVVAGLERFGKYELPQNVRSEIWSAMARYGRLELRPSGDAIVLWADDPLLLREVRGHPKVSPLLELLGPDGVKVAEGQRGHLKQALLRIGWPVRDLAGHAQGQPLAISLRERTLGGRDLELRRYQKQAVDAFWAGGEASGGSGVVVLPCGAGKTLVGLGVMAKVQAATLILCTSTLAVRQWIDELLDKTSLEAAEVGEYTGVRKEVRPVTVATYHILGRKEHLSLLDAQDWGLIVYDEVHLLPAPVFRMTAEIQARRRLGLTATLLREDGREGDVFSLIGPKKYDAPWKELEGQGWIAKASCTEVRLEMSPGARQRYAEAEEHEQFRLAAENPAKIAAVQEIVQEHLASGDRVLVIGRFLTQLEALAQALSAPLLTGQTLLAERERLLKDFRSGKEPLLVVSNVANFSLDLPEASVAIEVSGTFGSRQEEAQRLGRILRPKEDGRPAHFYALVSSDTREQQFAILRQRFLTEQGYRYRIVRYGDDASRDEGVVITLEEARRRLRGGSPDA